MTRVEAIVRRLASFDDMDSAVHYDYMCCNLCAGDAAWAGEGSSTKFTIDHDEDCPFRLAREWVATTEPSPAEPGGAQRGLQDRISGP